TASSSRRADAPGKLSNWKGRNDGLRDTDRKLYPVTVIDGGAYDREQNGSHRIFRCSVALGARSRGNWTLRTRGGSTTAATCGSVGPIDFHCIAGTTRPSARVLQRACRNSRY